MTKGKFWEMIGQNLDCPECPLRVQDHAICDKYVTLDEKKHPVAPCFNPEKLQEAYEKEMEDD
jgi:hypothetical protein